jgi:hypothetical protein
MSIDDVIDRIRREPPYARPHFPIPGTMFVCQVREAIAWNKAEIERRLGLEEIPLPLSTLWDQCGGLVLFEDDVYQQSGLRVLSPRDVTAKNEEYRAERCDQMLPGDLVFAEFCGDLRLVLLRTDKEATDYGSVMVVSAIDPRQLWYTPAHSLEEFLSRFIDAHGDDYWDVHYESIKAQRGR